MMIGSNVVCCALEQAMMDVMFYSCGFMPPPPAPSPPEESGPTTMWPMLGHFSFCASATVHVADDTGRADARRAVKGMDLNLGDSKHNPRRPVSPAVCVADKPRLGPRVLAWSRTLGRVVSYGPRDRANGVLANFHNPEQDEAVAVLLREGLAVREHRKERTRVGVANKVLVAVNEELWLCSERGQHLEADHAVNFEDVELACLGPCTIVLQTSLRRRHGSLASIDAVDDGRRCFSLLGRDFAWDLEVCAGETSDLVLVAQDITLRAVKAIFHRATPELAPTSSSLSSERWRLPEEYGRLFASDVVPLQGARVAQMLMGAAARESASTNDAHDDDNVETRRHRGGGLSRASAPPPPTDPDLQHSPAAAAAVVRASAISWEGNLL